MGEGFPPAPSKNNIFKTTCHVTKTGYNTVMRTYKLYAALSNSDNIANVDIVRSGRIRSIRYAARGDFDADAESVDLELSTQATNQLTTNDSIGDIDAVRARLSLTGGTESFIAMNYQRTVDFPVAANERVYLHCALAGATGAVTVYIDIEER